MLGVNVLGIGVKLGVTIVVGVLEGVPVATGGARLGVLVTNSIIGVLVGVGLTTGGTPQGTPRLGYASEQ